MKQGNRAKNIFYFILAFTFLMLVKVPPLNAFIYVFTATTILVFLSNITKKINFLDVTAMAASISYLLMPLITYEAFGEHNRLAALWRTFMTIDKNEYFLLALPGTIALVIGLWFPSIIRVPLDDGGLINNVRDYLKRKKIIGVILILMGLSSVPFIQWAPLSVKAIFYFASQLTYVGVIYLLYSSFQLKKVAIAFILALMVVQSVLTGMYGELIYWSIMGSIMLLINNQKFSMARKVALLGMGIVFLFLIQSVKQEYRDSVWKGAQRGNDSALFFSLFIDRVKDPLSIFEPERIYKVVVRGNQGFLVARAMDYVPKNEPFAHGETIWKSIFAAFVPRFLWSDKPTIGGKENICRFLGDCGNYNYSYNIGQLGEAYVNFGVIGGWIYMFFYGYLLNSLFNVFRYLSFNNPSLILWTPILFFPAMIVETDLLTFINTFIKGAMFCAFCYLILRLFFKIRL